MQPFVSFLWLLPIFFYFNLLTAYAEDVISDDPLLHYLLMIDAGSSGSRLHIYSYKLHDPLPNFYPNSQVKKIKPGVSSYANNPEELKGPIQELLKFAQEFVPYKQWRVTPIYLYGTAGLRKLQPSKADELLDVIRNEIEKFPFSFSKENARIISGKEEGVFAWIALNYLRSAFLDPSIETVGIVEMGGASSQVCFEPKQLHQSLPEEFSTELSLGGRKFNIYVHSYLNYGLQAAQERFHTLAHADLLKANGNPCYPRGYMFQDFSGTGDFEKCVELMRPVLFSKQQEETTAATNSDTVFASSSTSHNSSFNGVYQPFINLSKFFLTENFFYTGQFFHILENSASNLKYFSSLADKGRTFCAKPYSSLKMLYPREKDLFKYCFSAAFQSIFVQYGLEIPPIQTHVDKQTNGIEFDWTLGATIYESTQQQDIPSLPGTDTDHEHNSVFQEKGSLPAVDITYLQYWFFFIVFCILASILLYIMKHQPNRNEANSNNTKYISYDENASDEESLVFTVRSPYEAKSNPLNHRGNGGKVDGEGTTYFDSSSILV